MEESPRFIEKSCGGVLEAWRRSLHGVGVFDTSPRIRHPHRATRPEVVVECSRSSAT